MCNTTRALSRLWPFRSREESKRQGKHIGKHRQHTEAPEGGHGKRQKDSGYTQVSSEERDLMLQLRSEGMSMHAIADELGRSSRTVHKVVSQYDQSVQPAAGRGRKGSGKRARDGERSQKTDLHDALLEKIAPSLVEEAGDFLRDNRDVLEEILYKSLGMSPPRRTLDDVVERAIADSPEYRRRLVEHRLTQMERNGQSELDILERGLILLSRFVEMVNQGNWARVADGAVRSGELRKAIVELAAAFRGEGPSRRLEETAQTTIASDQPKAPAPPAQGSLSTPGQGPYPSSYPSSLRGDNPPKRASQSNDSPPSHETTTTLGQDTPPA